MTIFFNFLAHNKSFSSTTTRELRFIPHQIIFIYYNSRLVADEDDNGKFRLERVLIDRN